MATHGRQYLILGPGHARVDCGGLEEPIKITREIRGLIRGSGKRLRNAQIRDVQRDMVKIDLGKQNGQLVHQIAKLRIPTHPVSYSDNIRSVIPEYPVT